MATNMEIASIQERVETLMSASRDLFSRDPDRRAEAKALVGTKREQFAAALQLMGEWLMHMPDDERLGFELSFFKELSPTVLGHFAALGERACNLRGEVAA